MTRRVKWDVTPIYRRLGWKVERNRFEQRWFLFKYQAVNFAVKQCHAELEQFGLRSELLIKLRNGRYEDARTYGDDPRGEG